MAIMSDSMSFVIQSTPLSQTLAAASSSPAITTAEGFFNVRIYDADGKLIVQNIPVLGQDITPYEWGEKRLSEIKDVQAKELHLGVLQRIKNYLDKKDFEKELPMGSWEFPFVINTGTTDKPVWEEQWITAKVFFHVNTKKYTEAAKVSWKNFAYKK